MIDVAVVGGGPAGLLTAARLAGSGLDVVVFEEHPTIGEPTHCTGIISLETAELAKIPDDVVLGHLRHARLVGPGGAEARHTWTRGDADAILVVDRGAFDQGLARQALAAGAAVRTQSTVEEMHVAADGVTLRTAGTTVRARAAVLACGVSYRLNRQLGLGLPAQAIHTAQTEVEARADDVAHVYFGRQVAPGGFAWTVPVLRQGRPRLKVGVMANGDAGACLEAFLARPDVRERLDGEPPPPIRRLLPLQPVPTTYRERVLVVGDAGGFTKPTTGGGIFYGLLTATLAAETLLEAFSLGRLDASCLSRYAARWRARLGAEVRTGAWLRRVVTRCSDAQIDHLVTALAARDIEPLIGQTAHFNWHRQAIRALARQPALAAVLFRSFFQ